MLDLRLALRLALKNPGFAATVILVLALGIGANTAIFSTLDAVLLRPLAFRDPGGLMMVWEDASHVGFPKNTPAPANFVDWRAQNRSFADMAALRYHSANLTGDGPPEGLRGVRTMPNLFAVLGVSPLHGRYLTEQDEKSGDRVVVISYRLWQRRFGGDPKVVGKQIRMNDEDYEVVGVMPRAFQFPTRRIDYWRPSGFTPQDWSRRGSHFLEVVGRLKPGVSPEQAQGDMTGIARRLQTQYPNTNRQLGVLLEPMKDRIVGRSGLQLLVLMAAAGCVLLIACANVANLLLARAAVRSREMAVRAALGAGAGRLARQAFVESLFLAAAGLLLALPLAAASLRVIATLVPDLLVGVVEPRLDARVLLFASGIALLTGLLFGVVPAWQASRAGLAAGLRDGGRAGASRRTRVLRGVLVTGEVALASALLIGAGLLFQTLRNLNAVDLGFNPERVLTLQTRLPQPRYADFAKRQRYFHDVLDRVRALPGVQSAGFSSTLPFLQRGNTTGFAIEGREPIPTDALYRVVTADYLQTIGVRLREGRLYHRDDRATTAPGLVINTTLARTFFPNESALGKRIRVAEDRAPRTVIGVVEDVLERGLEQTAKPGFYTLTDQDPEGWMPAELAVKTAGDPEALANAVRDVVWSVDKDQPVALIQTLEKIVAAELADRRQQVRLLGGFALLALVLAGVGIYGVLAYAVSAQVREIGVRMALGARPGDVTALVVREGLRLALAGLALGALAALGLGRWMRSLLYEVKPADPATFAAVGVVLLAVSLAACYLPARRAARVDPLEALRAE